MTSNQFTRPVLAVIDEFKGLQKRTKRHKTKPFMTERKKFSRSRSALRERYEARGINVKKLQREKPQRGRNG